MSCAEVEAGRVAVEVVPGATATVVDVEGDSETGTPATVVDVDDNSGACTTNVVVEGDSETGTPATVVDVDDNSGACTTNVVVEADSFLGLVRLPFVVISSDDSRLAPRIDRFPRGSTLYPDVAPKLSRLVASESVHDLG